MSRAKRTRLRCSWARHSPLLMGYHDRDWSVPLHDDRKLCEFLALEDAQAGLSWETVLRKRENYRKAFHNFAPRSVARYTSKDAKRLLANPGTTRTRLKITAAIMNAHHLLRSRENSRRSTGTWRSFGQGCRGFLAR